jgi:hypothetical protein
MSIGVFQRCLGYHLSMSEPKLDWSTAEVRDAKLTVALQGDAPRGWKDTFEATARLLGGSGWDDVQLKKHNVRVSGVSPGSEDKLRHFLESVVQQANADHHTGEEQSQEGEGASDQDTEGPDDASEESEESPDAEMTERFRSFG